MRVAHLTAIALLFFCLDMASGQTAPPALKIGDVTVQGSIRTRFEVWDWFDAANADDTYGYSGTLGRLSFSQQRQKWDWQFELAAPILLGLPGNAIASGTQGQLGLGATYFASNDRNRHAAMVFPKQAFVRLKGLFGDDSQSLRLGRYEFQDGSEIIPTNATLAAIKRERVAQRLIGPFGFTHVGRSFDGFHYIKGNPKASLHVLGAMPTRGVFQVDGWGRLDVGFLYASLNGATARGNHTGDWRAFGMYYHDWRRVVKTDNRPLSVRSLDQANIRVGSYGGHYLHSVATTAGVFDFMGWGVIQHGRWGVQDHKGAAGDFEAGWQPPVLKAVRPWIRAGYTRTTGDPNPGDNKHETFFQMLPTPRSFARFPFYDMLNNEDIFGMVTLRPHKAVTVKAEVHAINLSNGNDLWYLGGGPFQPWTFGYTGRPGAGPGQKGLAKLYDVGVDYNLNPRTTVSVYVAHASGDSVARAIYPRNRNANFGYVELSHRF